MLRVKENIITTVEQLYCSTEMNILNINMWFILDDVKVIVFYVYINVYILRHVLHLYNVQLCNNIIATCS